MKTDFRLLKFRNNAAIQIASTVLLGVSMSFTVIPLCQAQWSEWVTNVEVDYSTNDNINNTFFDSATENDQTWELFASHGRIYQLTENSQLLLSAQTNGSIHHQFEQLDHIDIGAGLSMRHKFGVGPYRPWASIRLSGAHRFSRSVIRNGNLITAQLMLGKRLHERIDLSLNYTFDYRNSQSDNPITATDLSQVRTYPHESNSVFDLNGQSVGAQLHLLATQNLLLSLSYSFRDGDVVSTNEPGLIPGLGKIIDAIANDDALPGWAYRSNAHAHRYGVDANYALFDGHASINAGYQHIESDSDNFVYRSDIFRINFTYSF